MAIQLTQGIVIEDFPPENVTATIYIIYIKLGNKLFTGMNNEPSDPKG